MQILVRLTSGDERGCGNACCRRSKRSCDCPGQHTRAWRAHAGLCTPACQKQETLFIDRTTLIKTFHFVFLISIYKYTIKRFYVVFFIKIMSKRCLYSEGFDYFVTSNRVKYPKT